MRIRNYQLRITNEKPHIPNSRFVIEFAGEFIRCMAQKQKETKWDFSINY